MAKRLCSPEEANAFRLDSIEKEISILEKELSVPNQQIGFCHNDLQYGNIMIEEESKSITIIVSFSFCIVFQFSFSYQNFGWTILCLFYLENDIDGSDSIQYIDAIDEIVFCLAVG